MKIYNKAMKKILIVEDQKSIVKSLELNLKNKYQVFSLTSFSQAKDFDVSSFDLALVDLSLGDGSGLDLYKIFKGYKDLPIIFLTANDEEKTIVRALDMGADDYITKPFKLGELKARIRKILPDSLNFKDIEVDEINHRVSRQGKAVDLSAKEYELFLYLIRNKNRTLTRSDLLGIWEQDNIFVNDNTLSVTVNRLRKKLKLEELKTVKNVGYILDEKI